MHAKGSYFFIQLWAGGRASSASTLADPDVTDLHAPSAIPKPGGKTPREMSISGASRSPLVLPGYLADAVYWQISRSMSRSLPKQP